MKKFLLLFCFLFFSFHFSYPQGIWTWMSGPNTLNSGGMFGTLGVPSVNNYPPGTFSSYCWTDLQGNFWLFGGSDAGIRYYGDMWMFNPNTLEWTWVMGNGTTNPSPVFGTLGVPAPGNTPGGRYWSSCTWTDANGDFWLYGGFGSAGVYADLWKYNIASNEWTWMSGPNTTGQAAVYGTLGVPSISNNPGSRSKIGTSWVDVNGKLWMFSGDQNFAQYSDVWMYDPVTNMWTWESGPQGTGIPVVYGSKGVFAAGNTPGSRRPFAMMTEDDGNFLLFGGNNGTYGVIHADLWEYNPSINQWAWLDGSQSTNVPAVVGAICQSDSTFYPDARMENPAVWKDCSGNFWMYGGCIGQGVNVSDMWVYLKSSRQWSRMTSSNYASAGPIYGTLGVPASSNLPGAKMGPAHWKDKHGHFWIFGGFSNNLQTYDDMWRYVSDSTCIKTVCCTAYAGILTASRDSICQGSSATSTLSAGNNSGNLQWLSSTDAFHYSVIAGATSSSYTTPASLTQTTYYRLLAGDSTCSDTSAAEAVNVILVPVAGTVASSRDTICVGSGLKSTLNVTGSNGNLQWQSSTDSVHFSDLPGDTSSTYTTPQTLSQTTYYRIVVNGICGTDSSNILPVHIVPNPVANFTYAINGKQVTFNSDSSSKDVTTFSWNFGDNTSSTQPNPIHTYTTIDTFYVCFTVYNGSNCSYTLCQNVILKVGAGVKDITAQAAIIQLYPNPAGNNINLLVNGLVGNYQLKMYNVLEQEEIQQILCMTDEKIIPLSLKNLPEGTYVLILSNGNQYYSKQFVIEK